MVALDIIINNIQNIPEDQRIVIRNSINRIHDIANNLLTQFRCKNSNELDNAAQVAKAELVSDFLMSLISEKRAQYRNDAIELVLNLDENTYGKFSMVSVSSFNRVLSNLINNAAEALANEIEVNINVIKDKVNNSLSIKIQDIGSAISSEIIQKIRSGKSVSSKAKGHGLGLSYSIKTIEQEWNGQFSISSSINVGTTVEIILPQTVAPKWFLPKLIVDPKESVLILDDDESIHQVWRRRFKEIYIDFSIINHYSPQDFLSWYKNSLSTTNTYLIDYEFLGYKGNGLNIIKELNIIDRSYLVTSRHDDSSVREYCEQIGLKIIPKAFAVYIPILLSKNSSNSIFAH